MRSWGDWLIDSSLTIWKEGTWHTHKTRKKNLLKNKNICIIYFFYSDSSLSLSLPSNFLFRQYHCQKSNNIFFLFPSILAMPLPQTNCNNFFFPSYFANGIATNSLPQFFFPPISAMPLPQTNCNNFFFPPISAIPLPQINCHFFFFLLEKWYVHTIADMGGRFLVYMAGNFILILSNGFRLIELLSVE